MTLNELKTINQEIVTPADIAGILRLHPQSIRDQAQKDPKKLGFKVIVAGRRVLIPRKPFIQYIEKGSAGE